MDEMILQVRHLSKSFGKHEVLRDIDFTVNRGDVTSIIGASGSGKSTLLRCVNLLETPTSGEITFHGENILTRKGGAAAYRTKVGMVFQSFNLFNNMSVLDNCTVGQIKVLKKSAAEAKELAMKYLTKVGMAPYINAKPRQLSGGQKQRVAIARIFLKDPPILILDEATSALDSITEAKIQHAFDELSRGRTTLIIAHRLSTIRAAHRILVIRDGRIAEQGTHQQLLAANGAYAGLYHTQNLGEYHG
jgi:putative lysine transport system ATP-binding protein